ncbi:MAG: type II secretion system F family protein [Chloroflexi bacterium]|nr:type II secretion system F family protein [Chloroflexota bacterium]
MPIDYVAYNAVGARVSGVLEVDSEETAEEQLWAAGLIVAQLKREDYSRKRSRMGRILPALFGAKLSDAVSFTRQFETLLRAGVPIHTALRQLRDQSRSIAMRYAINQIVEDVEGGERFSRAVAKHPKVFPPYYIRMIPIAEESGGLARVLKDLLRTMERQQKVAAQAKSALLTPVISLGVGVVAALVLFTFVLPRLVELLGEFGTELPLATRILVRVADFSRSWALLIAAGVVVSTVLLTVYFSSTAAGKRLLHSMMLRAPVIGPVVRASTMFDVCSMFGLLLEAGIAPVVALRAVTGTISNVRMRDAFIRVDIEITEGQRLGATLRHYPVIPALFSETVANGEQAGALSANLHALADFYEGETERRVEASTSLIEPLAFLVVGGLIGFIAVAIISGIYSVIPSISSSARR